MEGDIHGMVLLPEALVYPVLKHSHKGTHCGRHALTGLIQPYLKGRHLLQTIRRLTQGCHLCAKTTPRLKVIPGGREQCKEMYSFEYWQSDVTQMPKRRENFRFLLVFVDIFSGWVEAYPTRPEKTTEVIRLLLKEIIPRTGLPFFITMITGCH